ncbi:MAG: hypothetical protein K0V04_07930 [Deltaproteobacteria bacterium]|nr:hypothetical protein [Deltaproteobacteria bacterium]
MRLRTTSILVCTAIVGCYQGPASSGSGGGDGTSDGPSDGSADSAGPADSTAGTTGTGTGTGTTDGTTSGPTTGSTSDDPPADTPLLERLEVTDIEVPQGVQAGVNNWRIWGLGPLHVAPVFVAPLADCGTLVGFSTGNEPTPRVARLDAAQGLTTVLDLPAGLQLRGLAAESDGHFGALLWDPAQQRIWIRRYTLAGEEVFSTELENPDNTPTDFGIGDSRLEFGDGTYGAYYHVHSDSGHEGDTLKWVGTEGAPSTGWGWGCSHSMSNLLRFNPAVGSFLPACVTDCFPGTSGDFGANSIGGIYLDHNAAHVLDVDAGCNGDVAGELGGAALAPNGWALVFNAHQAPATPGQGSYDPSTMNQDIGLSMVGGDLSPGNVVWLTSTADVDEDDASIARWEPAGDATEQYVVGWHEPQGDAWQLGRIDALGTFLEGPLDVGGAAHWGRRDDPFRQHYDGDVVWAWFDDPGSTTLHVARLRAGGSAECAAL